MGERSLDLRSLVASHAAAIALTIDRVCSRRRMIRTEREELTQELWLSVLREDGRILRRFEHRSAMTTYLFTVLHRSAGKWLAARSRRRRFEVEAGDTYEAVGDMLAAQLHERGADEGIRQADRRRLLEAALPRLSQLDRQLIELRRAGNTNIEISRTMGLSANAVDARTRRAIARLRRSVGGHA